MTNYETSQKDIQKNRERCRKIIELSPKIRYVGVINKFGRTLARQIRNGVIPLLQPDEVRNECFIEATRLQLRKNFESSIGKTEFTFTLNEKVKTLTLANQSNFYYITIEKDTIDTDVEKIIKSVKTLLNNLND
ncbi:MAG TPA: hypothetical protein VE244_16320 [Nitrososphaeraceae archaeon]|jgi:hypothetical protein|nr:hypothetical protein [Nitrososphaeraceae archaeon]